ncbi:hypothetical protein [Streptomyces noursei]|nr:hypothetical protein [Streptomyces noursei]MCZ1013658.1 hypothetical protein [Streptomyces noursei]GGX25120.1 hypothetical protein GCM10010341_52860 [Streptomyces noursei]
MIEKVDRPRLDEGRLLATRTHGHRPRATTREVLDHRAATGRLLRW